MGLPASAVQQALWRLIGWLSFNRIEVHGRPGLPEGPVLYLGLHRNGALDGVPYLQAVPDAVFLVSAQLQRSALGRFLFPGIPVARSKDRRRGIAADNEEGMERCVSHLLSGGKLFVLPEGTSSLGPRHLPFKQGAARIARAVLAQGRALTVVPMAVHYECAWEWQSRVEVVFGTPLRFEEPASENELHRQFEKALETMGINVDSPEELALVEMLAYGATIGTDLRYGDCLKHFEKGIPTALRQEALALETLAQDLGVCKHQGVPLVPIGTAVPYLLAWLLLAPLMLAFGLLNLPPLLAGTLAARKLPDERNVVAFWRAMVGTPVAIAWFFVMVAILGSAEGWTAVLTYGAVSFFGLRMAYGFRKLSAAAFNALKAPQIKAPLLALRQRLLESVGHG